MVYKLSETIDSLSFPAFAETALKIVTMEGKLSFLNLNEPQLKVHSVLEAQRRQDLPMRAIILKARREGVCLAPYTKILTSDLHWVEISKIPVGTSLMSVDENVPGGRGNHRRLRKSIINAKKEIIAPTFKLYMEDGRTLTATGQHRFMCRQRGGDYTQWRAVEKIKIGDYIRHVAPMWGEANVNDGWMGGLLDGEGTIRPKTRAGCEVTISQCFGAVYDKAKQYLIDNGYSFREDIDKRQGICNDGYNRKPMGRLVLGRLDEIFKLIGKTRPVRLLSKDYWEGKELPGKGAGNDAWVKITWIEPTGAMPVFDLQTTHKTFIAEGFVSHNSTYVEGRYFREINKRPMRYACVASADTDATDKVFNMAKLFQDEIPADLRRPTDYSNRKEIVYSAPWRSQFLCQTAGKDVLGRGGLTHYLHCTEFAFWQKAKEQFGGAAQEIPDDPETSIVIESTANGTGGAFYDMYVDAVERYKATKNLDSYLPIFLPWFIFNKYRKKLPRSWTANAEEKELANLYSLDLEQLCWRRWAIENKCQSDERLFKQEYPANWIEAFQASGAPVFTTAIIRYQEHFVRDDIQYGMFDPRTGDFMPNAGGSRYGWQVLDDSRSEEHTIGVDTREHRLTDEKDPKSKRDKDGVVVMSRGGSQRRVKAILSGQYGQKELGLQVLGAAKHYNRAWVVPEIPQGMMIVQVLADANYQNVYHRRSKELQYAPEDTEDMGFRTTDTTRHYLVNDMINVLRSNILIVQFADIIDQMKTFEYDKAGKPRHMPGKQDDLMFGLALAIQGDLHCPKNLSLAIPEYTGEPEEAFPRPEKTDDDLAYVGAVDDFDDYDDDEDLYYTE